MKKVVLTYKGFQVQRVKFSSTGVIQFEVCKPSELMGITLTQVIFSGKSIKAAKQFIDNK